MNPAKFTLKNKTFVTVITLLLIIGGIISYQTIGRLESPDFTIKTAMVFTLYPGASAKEVEEEVTDVLEEAIQTMGQINEIKSTSQAEVSVIEVEMKDHFDGNTLPQVWDELRRKVNDIQGSLPPGAMPSKVNDSFGDVYGAYFALTGDNIPYKQLKDYADQIKIELLGCTDVSKIDFWGMKQETIYIELQRAKMAQLGISPQQISRLLNAQNALLGSGKIQVDGRYMKIRPSGSFKTEKLIQELKIGGKNGVIRLGDIAKVTRAYEDPLKNMMRFNGKPSIGIGVSTIRGGNCVTMGKSINQKLKELKKILPEQIELSKIYFQGEIVTESVNKFVGNLAQSVAIVIILLMVFMGFQSGMLIGGILLLNILVTFVVMKTTGIILHKMSLGALILALGMLVDNAIVVSDGILVRVEKGEKREEAATEVVQESFWPLFGATLISIVAFGGVGYAPGNAGEFTRDLFNVMAISLSFSWILALTVTPLFCVWFLKVPKHDKAIDPYDGTFYKFYRKFLHFSLKAKWLTAIATIAILGMVISQAHRIPQSMFSDSPQPYFFVNYWKPQGTHINSTAEDMKKIETFTRNLEGIEQVTTYVGEGGLRFFLAYIYESPNSSYGQLVVKAKNLAIAKKNMPIIEQYIHKNFPGARGRVRRMPDGPPLDYPIEVEFRGKDPKILRDLAFQAEEIMRKNPKTRNAHNDWKQLTPVVQPIFSETQARIAGISRTDFSQGLNYNFSGFPGGYYREGNDLIPIVFRGSEKERTTLNDLESIPIFSQTTGKTVPVSQIITGVKTVWEQDIIKRKNRQKTITVKCEPQTGSVDFLQKELAIEIEKIELPPGYTLKWEGMLEQQKTASEPLAKSLPFCLLAMFIILLWLFNSIRNPLIIFATVPLSLIGVISGFIASGKSMEFMAIIGFLGLSGMVIKNSLVLIDQIELERKSGKEPYKAILDSSVSRLRPVVMAAGTTILGMLPLIADSLYGALATTVMSGLFIATFLTLLIVPVMYSIFFGVKPERLD